MFGLMKNLIKENSPPAETATLSDLNIGCVVGFGFMPQKTVSGKRLPITEMNSYMFDTDNFIAYRLSNDGADVNLIVADEEDPTSTYLAMSQKIEPRLYTSIFPMSSPQQWFALKENDELEVRPPVIGAAQGWLNTRYILVVSQQGRYLEGDWHLRKPADRGRFSRSFDYVLFVDEDNEYAIEAEKFEDGTINVYATIYRPATDIGEITRAPKISAYGSVESIPHVSLADVKKAETPSLAVATPLPAASDAKAETATLLEEVKKQETVSQQAASVETGKIEKAEIKPEVSSAGTSLSAANGNTQVKPETAVKTEVMFSPFVPLANDSKAAKPEMKAEAVIPAMEEKKPEVPVAATVEAVKTSLPEAKFPKPQIAPTKPDFSKNKTGTALAEAFKAALAESGTDSIATVMPPTETAALPEAVPEKPVEISKPAAEKVLEDVKPQEPIQDNKIIPEKTAAPKSETAIEIPPVKKEVSVAAPLPVITSSGAALKTAPAAVPASDIIAVASNSRPVVKETVASPPNTLACDLPLAARLIEEAQRTKMLLSDLVRKVIDLPAKVQDNVFIPFAVNASELSELAKRYNLPASDAEAVKNRIIEELEQFVGTKK